MQVMMLYQTRTCRIRCLPTIAALILSAVCISCSTTSSSSGRRYSNDTVPEYLLLETRYCADVLYTSLSKSGIINTVKQLLEQYGYCITKTEQNDSKTTIRFKGEHAKGSFCLQSIHTIPQKYNYIYRVKILTYPSTVQQDHAINDLADKLGELIGNLPPPN